MTNASSCASARRDITWDTTPLLALGHDRQLRELVLARKPGLLLTGAVHRELHGIGYPGVSTDDDKPREQARETLRCTGLLANTLFLNGGQQRRAETIRQNIIQATGQGGGHHGESEAIVHAVDDNLIFMTSDGPARVAAAAASVSTACLVDVLWELIGVQEIDGQEAADLCADLKENRMFPGRQVTGPLDIYSCSEEPLIVTDAEWAQL